VEKYTVLRAYKTELDLNNAQRTACALHAGAARYTYNWGLARKIEAHQLGQKFPTAIDLHRELTILKKTNLSWMYKVSKCAPQEALRDLDRSFQNFFRRVKQKKAGKRIKAGFPHFRTKKAGQGSFRLYGTITVFDKAIQLPRLGILRLKENGYLPTEGVRILNATVSEKAGRWFVSLQVEIDLPKPEREGRQVAGIDLGIHRLAQVSDGTYFQNPRALQNSLDRIRHLQRLVSRRKKGSNNRQKVVRKLAEAHLRVANIRKDVLHQITTKLTRTKSAILIEDLNVTLRGSGCIITRPDTMTLILPTSCSRILLYQTRTIHKA
jgi:putative transposase